MAAKSLQLYVSDSEDEAELEDVDAEKPTRKYKCHNYVLIQTITGFKIKRLQNCLHGLRIRTKYFGSGLC
jgi:hypothetical protein